MYNSLVYHVDKWKKNIKIPFGNCRRSVANIWVKKKAVFHNLLTVQTASTDWEMSIPSY